MLALALLMALVDEAQAADVTVRAAKVRAWIDTGKEDAARAKCEAWGARNHGADPRLRHVCAEVWLADAERADTFDSWSTFRTEWSDTSWATGAKKREAELSLDAVGYDATEADYLAVGDKYPGTPTAALAYERAAESALRSIKTPEEVVGVARRYPSQVPNLLRTHLEAFVNVELDAQGAMTVNVDPTLIDPKTLSTTWVSRQADGKTLPWVDALVAHLAKYGVPEDVARNAADRTTGPPFPACADPGTTDVWTIDVQAATGHAYVPVAAPESCGPDVKTPRLLIEGGKVSAIALADRKVVLAPATSGWTDVRALVAATGSPTIGQGRVEIPAGGATIVVPLSGGAPWVVGRAMTRATPLQPALGVGEGNERPLAPIVMELLGAGASALGTAPNVPTWTGPKPAGATPATLATADLTPVRAAAAWAGLKSLAFTTAWQLDLDGDKSAELIAEGSVDGKPVIAVLRPSSNALWVWTSDQAAALGPASAFGIGGRTVVAWNGVTLVSQGKSFALGAR